MIKMDTGVCFRFRIAVNPLKLYFVSKDLDAMHEMGY